jgi:hypothetical protein
MYFCYCRDECLRRWAEFDRLRNSGRESNSDSDRDCGGDCGDNSAGDDPGAHRDFAGNLVLGHQLQ